MGKSFEKNQKNWEALFQQLKDFKESTGGLPTKKDSQRLYTWCAVQRLKRKRSTLSDEKIAKLDSLEFIWNVQDHVWAKNYALLLEYRQKHKTRWPSQRSEEEVEHKLAVWFLGIRKDFKKNKLAPERIQKLKEIGFPFYPREYRWEQTYEKVLDWIDRHSSFPMRGSKNSKEQKLFNWCRYQAIKREYGALEEYQVNALNEIDIDGFIAELKEFERAKAEAKKFQD